MVVLKTPKCQDPCRISAQLPPWPCQAEWEKHLTPQSRREMQPFPTGNLETQMLILFPLYLVSSDLFFQVKPEKNTGDQVIPNLSSRYGRQQWRFHVWQLNRSQAFGDATKLCEGLDLWSHSHRVIWFVGRVFHLTYRNGGSTINSIST